MIIIMIIIINKLNFMNNEDILIFLVFDSVWFILAEYEIVIIVEYVLLGYWILWLIHIGVLLVYSFVYLISLTVRKVNK